MIDWLTCYLIIKWNNTSHTLSYNKKKTNTHKDNLLQTEFILESIQIEMERYNEKSK